eukprot:UN02462
MASKDLFISDQQEFVSKNVKGSSITDEKLAGNSIIFQYCYSRGYEKVYRQLASVLEQQFGHQYPDLVISGENYNPGSFRLEISQVLGMVKMIR